jgi:uncharacterized RDD family membrane protein YckC
MSHFEDRLTIGTPEGVEVELTLAGIGSRFIAAAIDVVIELVVIGALAIALNLAGAFGAALFTSLSFALIFFYDVLFEVLGGGKTPGKRLAGLRVVRSGGRPITFVRSALRNILRIIDILPGFYAVGTVTIFITSRNQRVGDLAAGANVIRDRHGGRRGDAPVLARAVDAGPAAGWDVSAVSTADVGIVRAFLERRDELERSASLAIARDLAQRLRPRVGGVQPTLSDEQFLELLVAAKAARR